MRQLNVLRETVVGGTYPEILKSLENIWKGETT